VRQTTAGGFIGLLGSRWGFGGGPPRPAVDGDFHLPVTQIVARDRPVAFISSFDCEKEGYASYRNSPLWQLRQDLAALNGDEAFRRSLPFAVPRTLTWERGSTIAWFTAFSGETSQAMVGTLFRLPRPGSRGHPRLHRLRGALR
jgi:hypothetical protein